MAGGEGHPCPGSRCRCLQEGDVSGGVGGGQEGLAGHRKARAQTQPARMLEETCPDCAVLAKGSSWSFWEPLVASLQLLSSARWCPEQPSPGLFGVCAFISLFKSLHRLLQSISLQKRAQCPEITLSLLLLPAAASRRFNPSHSSLLAFPGWWQELWHLSPAPWGHLPGVFHLHSPGRGAGIPLWNGLQVRRGPGVTGEVGPQRWGTG